MYKIYDSVSYGHLEPLVPFTLVAVLSTFDEVIKFMGKYNNKGVKFFIFDEKNNEIKYE